MWRDADQVKEDIDPKNQPISLFIYHMAMHKCTPYMTLMDIQFQPTCKYTRAFGYHTKPASRGITAAPALPNDGLTDPDALLPPPLLLLFNAVDDVISNPVSMVVERMLRERDPMRMNGLLGCRRSLEVEGPEPTRIRLEAMTGHARDPGGSMSVPVKEHETASGTVCVHDPADDVLLEERSSPRV